MGVQVLHGKDKSDLMTGGGRGDKNRSLEARGLPSLALKKHQSAPIKVEFASFSSG